MSSGLLRGMRREEVEGVLAHEMSHIQNGDMVTMTLVQGVVNAFVLFASRVIANIARNAVDERMAYMVQFIVTIVLDITLGLFGAMVVAWFSRAREFRADAGAAALMARQRNHRPRQHDRGAAAAADDPSAGRPVEPGAGDDENRRRHQALDDALLDPPAARSPHRGAREHAMSARAAAWMVVAAALALPRPAAAQTPTADSKAVQAAVEHFLDVLGNRDLDRLPALFAPKATMAVIRQRDGQWTSTVQSFEEWLGGLRSQTTATKFQEPLTGVSVNVEDGRLAFLRADFTVVIAGEVRSHGVDYFTLVKDGDAWKILNGAYTSHPGAAKASQ